MQTESSKNPLNIEQLVSSAVREFKEETATEVSAEVVRILIERGQKEQAHLEEEYKQQKFTTEELSRAIKELLSEARLITEARLIAHKMGREIIDATTIEVAMRLHCPVFPYC